MIKMISKISVMTLIMISCNLFSDEVHIKEGQLAPDFTLLDQNGKPHTLSTYIGKKVVIYFYPKDDTPGCTKEACSIRDSYDDFINKDIVVLELVMIIQRHIKNLLKNKNFPLTYYQIQKNWFLNYMEQRVHFSL